MKKAFSLIELLVVVIIAGVVYTLAVGNFQNIKDEKEKVTLQNLKEQLQKIPYKEKIELLCLNNCSDCDVFVDGKKAIADDSFDGFIDNSIVVYRYEFNQGVSEITKKVYFNTQGTEEDVCFSFSVDKKGVGEQVLVKFKERVYDFSNYFGSIPVYHSLQEAIDAKEGLIREVLY